jgi:tetratricopeptide (TPR) repeat protein
MAYRNLGNSTKALADFDEPIRRDPKDGHPFRERAQLYYRQKKFDRAIADANEAIQRNAEDGKAHLLRGQAYARSGEPVKAGDDFAEAVRLAPADSLAHNALAWHLATSPLDQLRNGTKAFEHASRACELSFWKNAAMLDTLAAAHAECGRFDEAIKWETKALELANKQQAVEYRPRLQLYQTNRPYRQPKEIESKT